MGNILELAYNTEAPKMVIPEYGRNVQKMIDHAITIDDKEERNKCAKAIVTVMGQINQHIKDNEDVNEKLWSHLLIMSDFKLDVDFPYEKTDENDFKSKPESVPYPKNDIQFGHYGKIMENLIDTAIKYPEGDEKKNLTIHIANLLKTSYLLWNRDTVVDSVIVKNLDQLSNGKLNVSVEDLRDTSDILRQYKKKKITKSSNNSKYHKHKNRR
jgi:hypothetical protein